MTLPNHHAVSRQAEKLAQDVLSLSKNILLVNLRYMGAAVNALKMHAISLGGMATDGQQIYYNPWHVLKGYKADKETTARDLLHIYLHCIFHHPFIHSMVHQAYWDLAVDIAVESTINNMGLDIVDNIRQPHQGKVLADLQGKLKMLTAEKIYRHLLDNPPSEQEYTRLAALFYCDDHAIWYKPEPPEQMGSGTGERDDEEGAGDRLDQQDGKGDGQDQQEGDGNSQKPSAPLSREELEALWKKISQQIQVDMETTSRNQGIGAGNMTQNLREVNRQRYDYKSFLQRFAVLGEAMQVNDDEFDMIFYTYGLNMYKNMPLIEPLEYKEVKRIKEFVIAIDTSGSVSGGLVQKFIEKTYNIFKQTENFFTKVNIHIIQCDYEIQEAAKITNQEEFDRYLAHMTLKGFGGTDFRPVFDYVDDMIRNKEFTNLKGLIYFTDGYGTFPAKKPIYDTACVFIRDDYGTPDVPPWVIRLVLEPGDIDETQRII